MRGRFHFHAMFRRFRFIWSYFRKQVPWDTNQTPPEVIEFVANYPVGRALDLGCGTGTNVIYLAQRGWETVGVDYVPQAISIAQRKAKSAKIEATFHHGDVTHLEKLPLPTNITYFLDVGCFHTLEEAGQRRYAAECRRLAAPGAYIMLYASFPRIAKSGYRMGVTPEEVANRFAPHFTIDHADYGSDTGGGWKRAWYWLKAGETL